MHAIVKKQRLKRASAAALLSVSLPSIAPAADLSDVFYLDLSAGPSTFMLHMDDSSINDALANNYWGIDGRLGLCSKGLIGVCGGLNGFNSLGSTSQTLTSSAGGGETETAIRSVGAYVQAKANLGVITLSPYAGYRQVYGDVSVRNNTQFSTNDIDTGAYYGGIESTIRFLPTNLEVGARFEYGKSTGNAAFTDYSYGAGSAFLRMRF
ncbi:hypothetical protein [Martelella mediterranea]|uniref:Outer membrane protein beta-barrel domain-containing protein n=1 Tax=Martelella mediterranea TaxID=293089 RepID=A0A4R3NJI8_9HYPH|nr:hypothetical protein [Martelella mediterranea]TCT35213.1 hypothetical protein EDC90_102838 [Martelella mediterranea]